MSSVEESNDTNVVPDKTDITNPNYVGPARSAWSNWDASCFFINAYDNLYHLLFVRPLIDIVFFFTFF